MDEPSDDWDLTRKLTYYWFNRPLLSKRAWDAFFVLMYTQVWNNFPFGGFKAVLDELGDYLYPCWQKKIVETQHDVDGHPSHDGMAPAGEQSKNYSFYRTVLFRFLQDERRRAIRERTWLIGGIIDDIILTHTTDLSGYPDNYAECEPESVDETRDPQSTESCGPFPFGEPEPDEAVDETCLRVTAAVIIQKLYENDPGSFNILVYWFIGEFLVGHATPLEAMSRHAADYYGRARKLGVIARAGRDYSKTLLGRWMEACGLDPLTRNLNERYICSEALKVAGQPWLEQCPPEIRETLRARRRIRRQPEE